MARLHILGLLLGSIWGFAAQFALADVSLPLVVDTTSSQRIALGKEAQIRNAATDERWRSQTESISLGFSPDLHQLEFHYEVTKQGAESNWLLDLGSGRIRHVHLQHFIDEALVEDFQTGTAYPLSSRAVEYHEFVFPLSMREGQHRLHLEIRSYNSLSITPILQPPLEWFAEAGATQWLTGGMIGTFLMLALYNLVVFGSTHERVFLLFSISCFAGALWRASDLGLTAQYLYPNWPDLYEPVSRLSVGAYIGFLLLFCREFFRAQDYAPKLAQAALYASCCIMAVMLFPVFRYAPGVGLLSILVCPALSIAIVVRARLQGIPGSGIFLFGIGLMTAGGVLTIARMQGWVGPVFEFRFVADVSFVVVTLLTSIALAARLSEEKLKRELAVTATKAKSLFLANMSHELRTPLNAIVGFSDLLHDSNVGDEHKGFARRIDTASKSLLGTISDLLDYSKLEAGQLVVENEPVDVGVLVSNVHSLFEQQAAEAGLTFSTHVNPQVPVYFLGDVLRLTQVLNNLVSNALKFTSQGSVLIRVLPATRAPIKTAMPTGSRWINFEVRDTGIGLTQDQQSVLFVPFAQADSSTTRRFGGTGLGLSICKELVERMGGVVTLRSRPNKGSCFRFSLCLEASVAPPEQQLDSNQVTVDLSPFKVLVVEDNKTNQVLIRAMLKKSGIAFQIAENGREALRALEQVQVDMVLMDCQMPEMDGYAATQAIREELGFHHLPIVALTANASPEDRRRCIATGMNDFLTKPLRYQQLLDVLHKWVPSGSSEAANAIATGRPLRSSASLLETE